MVNLSSLGFLPIHMCNNKKFLLLRSSALLDPFFLHEPSENCILHCLITIITPHSTYFFYRFFLRKTTLANRNEFLLIERNKKFFGTDTQTFDSCLHVKSIQLKQTFLTGNYTDIHLQKCFVLYTYISGVHLLI